MTVKRRNHGRNRHGRNHTRLVNCDGCGCKPAKDKAIKRFTVRNVVDKSAKRDFDVATAIEHYEVPKFHIKLHYCVSCAVHRKTVRPRSKDKRKVRSTGRPMGRPGLRDKYTPGGGQGAPGAGQRPYEAATA
mmetsp:Transcript_7002/g.21311  ORF Transcript_7002/g.21311 Transcript_7002/m.21311 type:complete len:132 (+) Transcript_7002:82-477(+)|eukprot:CAMPEP_0198727164 /NCGR_PEP_ID=MMETSP1475-20131203/3984_1 /TAXON_ID= ORGANISM="Unidentified sp., Strain CCMP1999" /NCGR_SAMPLE_ID=MMETSP1475 /ASSEMBLY_ACC=CAM_ASM_001111 /LENGTH=131 /DNA_ID=CAMNT_0044489173 /DNA_START=86 /DNA_END=481 /DNA_ORIENTATION=+